MERPVFSLTLKRNVKRDEIGFFTNLFQRDKTVFPGILARRIVEQAPHSENIRDLCDS